MPTVKVFDVKLFDAVVVAESDGRKYELSLQCRRQSTVQRPDALLYTDDVNCTQQSTVLEVLQMWSWTRSEDRFCPLALDLRHNYTNKIVIVVSLSSAQAKLVAILDFIYDRLNP